MPFTSHGHPVPGLAQEERPKDQQIARCGGPGMCVKCSSEAGQALRAFIRGDDQKQEGKHARRNGTA